MHSKKKTATVTTPVVTAGTSYTTENLIQMMLYQNEQLSIQLTEMRLREARLEEENQLRYEEFQTSISESLKRNTNHNSSLINQSLFTTTAEKLDSTSLLTSLDHVRISTETKTKSGLLEIKNFKPDNYTYSGKSHFNIFEFARLRSQKYAEARKRDQGLEQKLSKVSDLRIGIWSSLNHESALQYTWDKYHSRLAPFILDSFELLYFLPTIFDDGTRNQLERMIARVAEKYVAVEIMITAPEEDFDVKQGMQQVQSQTDMCFIVFLVAKILFVFRTQIQKSFVFVCVCL